MTARRMRSIVLSRTHFHFIALAEMQRLLPLSKVCRLTSCTIRAQPFTLPWCWSTQANSRKQRITLDLPKTANFIRKRKSCSTKQRRSSSRHLQFPHRQSRRPAEHARCRLQLSSADEQWKCAEDSARYNARQSRLFLNCISPIRDVFLIHLNTLFQTCIPKSPLLYVH